MVNVLSAVSFRIVSDRIAMSLAVLSALRATIWMKVCARAVAKLLQDAQSADRLTNAQNVSVSTCM